MNQVKLDETINTFLQNNPFVPAAGYIVAGVYQQSYGVDVIKPTGGGLYFTVYNEADPEQKVVDYLSAIFEREGIIQR